VKSATLERVLFLLLALLLRLTALWAWSKTPFWQIPVADEKVYHEWAALIASGTYVPQSAYEFSPLPAYFFAMIYKLFGVSPLAIRMTNVILSTATVGIIAAITRILSGRKAALISAIVSAIYMPFIFYSVTRMKTTLSVFLFACFVYTFLCVLQKKRLRWVLALGLVSSLCFQTRGNYLCLFPVALCALFIAIPKSKYGTLKLKALCLFALGALSVMAPVAIHNAEYDSKLVFSTTQGGFNFYLGNHHLYDAPWSRPTRFASPDPYVQGPQFTLEAHRRDPDIQSAGEASIFWYITTVKEMQSAPIKSLKKTVQKCLAVFHYYDACDHFNLSYLRPYIPIFFSLPFPTFTIIFPFGMAGLLLSRQQRMHRWLMLIALAYAGTLVLFFSNGRYRLPLLVCLIPAAATGWLAILSAIKTKQHNRLFSYFASCILFLLLEFIPLKGDSDFSAHRATHGAVLDISGNKTDARKLWVNAVRQGGDFAPAACIELAKMDCRNGNLHNAEAWLDLISDASYAQASRLALLAQIRVIQHRFNDAERLLRASLAINSGDLQVRELLIGVLQQTSPKKANEERKKQDNLRSFYHGL
jgi:4-amino-4-deoxy-L-arabinose transferase-like glycosyltransferase